MRPKGIKSNVYHKWTNEEKEFIKNNVKGVAIKDLTKLFNETFGTDLTIDQVRGVKKRDKFNSGPVKTTPHNKGMKGLYSCGSEKGWFKKGHQPKNYRPVGSERVTNDGYIEVKVADPNKWQLKHRVKYVEYYGNIPEGCVVVFADSDKSNFNKDNLIAVTRRQLCVLNNNSLIKNNAELTKVGINLTNLFIKIQEREK